MTGRKNECLLLWVAAKGIDQLVAKAAVNEALKLARISMIISRRSIHVWLPEQPHQRAGIKLIIST